MHNFARERSRGAGFSVVGLVFWLAVGAGAYFLLAAGPSVGVYLEVRELAQKMAKEGLSPYTHRERLIQTFMSDVFDETGVTLYRHQVHYRDSGGGKVEVKVDLQLPMKFPVLQKKHVQAVTISVSATKA